MWEPLLLSFRVSAVAVLAASVLGIAVGALLERRRFPGRELVDALITVPMVLPPTVLGYYLLVLLGRRSLIGGIFEETFGGPIVFTVTGATVAAFVGAFPFIVKSSRSSLESVDHRLVQAARTLGAGPLRAFLTVHLPLASRGIAAGIVLGFARALGDFGVTLMIAGNIPGETRTAALAIYDGVQAGRSAEAGALALALSLMAVAFLYAINRLGLKAHEA